MADQIIAVVGWEQLAAVARDLKAAGSESRGLKNELQRALRKGGEPLKTEAVAAAREELPQSGGLAEYVATETKFAIRTRLSRNPSVRITGTHRKKVAIGEMDGERFGTRRSDIDRGKIRRSSRDGSPIGWRRRPMVRCAMTSSMQSTT